jgi:methionine synthase I (cobalamin-dependent)
MHDLLRSLLAHGPVLTDGAWGTELQRRGLQPGECPETWNLSHPDQVGQVAQSYVQAGSRIILTNTFGGNRLRLHAHGLAEQTQEINRRGAALSRQAAGDRAMVFASIGPSGHLLMSGDVDPNTLSQAYAEQARALAEGGAHALVIETMGDPDEAALAIAAARETGLPVVACMVFDSGRDHDRTLMGTTPEVAARRLTDAGADVVGANCGQGIEGFLPLCRRLRAATDRPLWIKANAGLPIWVDGRAEYTMTPVQFAGFAPALIEAGAQFLGGCCGTRPEFIRALAHRLHPLPSPATDAPT